MCQCPLGLLPHFYKKLVAMKGVFDECQCPLGLLPHFYEVVKPKRRLSKLCVNALSGCYLISTWVMNSMLIILRELCQCPLGLLPHFYWDGKSDTSLHEKLCQCPLGLLPHFYSTPSKT